MLSGNPLSVGPLSSLSGATYTLTPDLGTYAVTGSSVTFTHTYHCATVLGTYAVSGSSTTFTHTYHLATSAGLYAETGSTVAITKASKLVTVLGTYAETGNAVSFTYSGATTYQLETVLGTYSETGNSVAFTHTYHCPTSLGTYSVSGNSATLTHTYNLSVAAGSYAETGNAVSFQLAHKLPITAGTYSLTGSTVGVTHTDHLNPVAGVYSTTGNNAAFSYSGATYKLQTVVGTYSTTGSSPTLHLAHKLATTLGTYSYTGNVVRPFYNQSESFTLNFLVDLLPAEGAISTEYVCRLLVDGTEIKVKEFTYREEERSLTGLLDVQLANVADRSLILKDSVITFDIGSVVDNVTSYDRVVDTGVLGVSDYSISRQGIGPADTFTLTTKPYELVRLQTSYVNGGVLYDPAKVEINESDWPTIAVEDGSIFTPDFAQVGGLTWKQVANAAFVNVAGFDSVETNIPDFEVSIAEFKPGDPVVNIVGTQIGSFEPDFSAKDNVLYIRDGTSGVPAGMPSPRAITVSDATRIGVNLDQSVSIDGILLTYSADAKAFDSSSTRTETENSSSGSGDNLTNTVTTKTYKDYFRNSVPNVPQRTELLTVAVDIYHTIKTYASHTSGSDTYADVSTSLELTESSTETFNYNDKGFLFKRIKTGSKRLPMPDGDTVPTNDNRSPLKTTDTFTASLVDSLYEIETVNYKAHPFRKLRLYISDREIHTSGIIYVDVDNPQLDQPYAQDANKVYEAGNVTTSSIPTWGAIHSYIETGTPLRGGQVRMHILEVDQVAGCVLQNHDEWREGDLGIASMLKEPREVLIGTHTSGVIDTLHAGEAPLWIGVPLAHRVLDRKKTLTQKTGFTLPFVDTTIKKGLPVEIFDRDANSLGTYVIEARTITGTKEYWSMQITARQAA
jgi:hypothetical protein